MAIVNNPYDTLYNNLKNKYTVIYGDQECTVGDYMLKKAGAYSPDGALVPAVRCNEHNTLSGIVEYVNGKLTVKNPPRKEKTLRRFPLRTSLSALLSSVAACVLVLSLGIMTLVGRIGTNGIMQSNDEVCEQEISEGIDE